MRLHHPAVNHSCDYERSWNIYAECFVPQSEHSDKAAEGDMYLFDEKYTEGFSDAEESQSSAACSINEKIAQAEERIPSIHEIDAGL